MKYLSLAAGALGILMLLVGFLGRFIGAPEIFLFGQAFAARTFVDFATTLLLVGIFVHLLSTEPK
jgi:hypothetical protein